MTLTPRALRFLSIPLVLVATLACGQQPSVTVESKTVATLEDDSTAGGTKIDLYTMTNAEGTQVSVLTHGATITGVWTADRNGKRDNITLHFTDPARYLKGHPLFGSVVGRYANRIAEARFAIDGKTFPLEANAGKNHIHGGRQGFQRIVWSAKPVRNERSAGVELTHTSPAGHAGYPGNLSVTVQYLLTADNQLVLEYWATTDKPTHVNLTNHAYWNLAGVTQGNVLDHVMTIRASEYLEASPQRFPTGKLLSVAGTPMDFRKPMTIGSRIEQLESKNYDDCYVIDRTPDKPLAFTARAEDPKSGRVMEVYTTAPGVQFYTAKSLQIKRSDESTLYGNYHGFCLETQHYPDSPNQPKFPSTLLRPGEQYHQRTVHKFSVSK